MNVFLSPQFLLFFKPILPIHPISNAVLDIWYGAETYWIYFWEKETDSNSPSEIIQRCQKSELLFVTLDSPNCLRGR